MNSVFVYAFLVLIALTFNSCKKEKGDTVVVVEFKSKINGENLVLNSGEYINISGYKIKFQALRFYLSNLKLIRDDNSELLLKDVEYIDFANNHTTNSEKGEQIIIKTEESGKFKSLKFAVGVDPLLNNGDPSVYPQSHPLSSYNGEHWGWNTGYIFFKTEGRYDTLGTDVSLAPIFLFHIGTNPLYLEKEFSKNFTVNEGDTTRLRIIIDAGKLFFSATDTINLSIDHNTQTTNNFSLAERMKNTLSSAMLLE
jgi:hypothetical protein